MMNLEQLQSSLRLWAAAQSFSAAVDSQPTPPPLLDITELLSPAEKSLGSAGVCITVGSGISEDGPDLGIWLPISGQGGAYVSTLGSADEIETLRLPSYESPEAALSLVESLVKRFLSDCAETE